MQSLLDKCTPMKYVRTDIVVLPLLNICELIDLICEREGWDFQTYIQQDYEELNALIAKEVELGNAYYYSYSRENYNPYEAAEQAIEAGNSRILCEDLS